MKSLLAGGIVGTMLAMSAGSVTAQEESTNRVGTDTDWSYFVETDPEHCWVVSAPEETVNTQDGRVVAVRRGEILLFVSFIPSQEIDGQVAFNGGYPFAEGSTVTLEIGEDSFDLYPIAESDNPEMAWSRDNAADQEIIAAMKRGAKASVTGRSSRGTTTKDTFSLYGFSAMLDDAQERCSG